MTNRFTFYRYASLFFIFVEDKKIIPKNFINFSPKKKWTVSEYRKENDEEAQSEWISLKGWLKWTSSTINFLLLRSPFITTSFCSENEYLFAKIFRHHFNLESLVLHEILVIKSHFIFNRSTLSCEWERGIFCDFDVIEVEWYHGIIACQKIYSNLFISNFHNKFKSSIISTMSTLKLKIENSPKFSTIILFIWHTKNFLNNLWLTIWAFMWGIMTKKQINLSFFPCFRIIL